MKKTILITVALTIAAFIILILIFIYSGIYNVSQLAEHNDVVRWVINTTKDRSIHSRANDIKTPALTDNTMITAGFSHFDEMCVTCHGAPGQEPGELVKGLTPKPPKLYEQVKDLEPNEAFWVIKNGIKYTSMPGFGPTHTNKDIWNIVAFLKNKLGNMSPEEYKQWQQQYGEEKEGHHE